MEGWFTGEWVGVSGGIERGFRGGCGCGWVGKEMMGWIGLGGMTCKCGYHNCIMSFLASCMWLMR